MPITNYNNISQTCGRAGHIATSSQFTNRISRNVGGQARQKRSITFSAGAAVENEVVIDGVTVTFTPTAASAAGAANGLYLACVALATLGHLIFEYAGSGAVLYVEERDYNDDFSIDLSGLVGPGTAATTASVTAYDAGDNIPPGVFVVQDPNNDALVLPCAPSSLIDTWTITPASVNTSDDLVFELSVEQPDGTWIPYNKKVDVGASVQATVEAIQPILDAIDGITATENNTTCTLVHDTPGLRIKISVQVLGGNGTTCALANTITGLGNPFYSKLLGAVCIIQDQEMQSDGTFTYEPGEGVTVAQEDEVDLLTESGQTLTNASTVYVRATASASEQKGAIRSDSDSGDAFPVKGIEVVSTTRTGIDGQRITRCRINL